VAAASAESMSLPERSRKFYWQYLIILGHGGADVYQPGGPDASANSYRSRRRALAVGSATCQTVPLGLKDCAQLDAPELVADVAASPTNRQHRSVATRSH